MPDEEELEARQPAHSAGNMDFSAILDELVSVIERAKSMPLSSSALISREEVLDLLLAARDAFPVELARARRLLVDRDELMQRAEREASELLDEARAQAAHMVERTEIVRQARNHGERVVAEAESDARRTRHEADDYVDRKLAQFEIVLDRTIRTVQSGRERLMAVPDPDQLEKAEKVGGDRSSTEGLFDQDQGP